MHCLRSRSSSWRRGRREPPDLAVLSVEEAHPKIPTGGVLALPTTLLATFSDDSIRPTQVNWTRPDPSALMQVGRIEVAGTVDGYKGPVKAIVDVVLDVNLIPDSSFESGKLDPGWILAGDGIKAAAPVEKNPGNAHSGDWSFKYWLDKPFQFTLTKRFTGLKDGKYSFRAWAMGGGGEKDYFLFVRGYGGPEPLGEDREHRVDQVEALRSQGHHCLGRRVRDRPVHGRRLGQPGQRGRRGVRPRRGAVIQGAANRPQR